MERGRQLAALIAQHATEIDAPFSLLTLLGQEAVLSVGGLYRVRDDNPLPSVSAAAGTDGEVEYLMHAVPKADPKVYPLCSHFIACVGI